MSQPRPYTPSRARSTGRRPLSASGLRLPISLSACLIAGVATGLTATFMAQTTQAQTTQAQTTQARVVTVLPDTGFAPPGPVQDEPSFDPLPPPSLNFYGSPGLIDMPSGEMLPDGQFTTTYSYFGGQQRLTLTFQPTPWASASFRYNGISNWNLGGFATYYDRGFDVRFRLHKETRRWPQITLGFQDFVGTGIYAAEYLVATKTFATRPIGGTLPGRLKLTAGLGWGRLGSNGSIFSYGTRPAFNVNSTGGQVAYETWFRGPAAPFGGIEWQINNRWGVKLEYSSDAYVTETQTTSVFQRKSAINYGVEWQATPRTRLGAYYLYGSEIGVNAQIQLNPRRPAVALAVPAPHPIQARPDRTISPQVWETTWADSQTSTRATALSISEQLKPLLDEDGLVLESLDLSAHEAELRFRNLRYRSFAQAVGRAARAMAQVLPASVETFRLVPVTDGLAMSATIIRRSDLEALEHASLSTQGLQAVTGFADVGEPSDTAVIAPDLYPDLSWSVSPYFAPAYFDPDQPVRLDVGAAFRGTWRPAPGWTVSGTINQRIAGNVKNGRASNSVLPHVRTDQAFYAQYGTTLNNLFVSKQWKPAPDLYARVTAGYLEYMYGGLSGEVLWKPAGSNLALGVEANYVRQRAFDQRLGFRDYSVLTGHASAYYAFENGFTAQVDVGRYLAGDVGATFAMDRVFDNGWAVGGFFTLTNVSATEFGEGSFDKGIRFRIPLSWFLGKPSRRTTGTTIRPIQRDGGQRVGVPGRLYPQVYHADRRELSRQWARAWE